MKHNARVWWVGVVVMLALGALALPTPHVTRAQSDPTLDAAQMAIWQATRRAQMTREAYDAQLAAQRATQAGVNAEHTRRAGEATRTYAETKSALDAYATLQAIDAQATRAAMQAEATATQAVINAEATRGAATQTAIRAATREAETRAAIGASATAQAEIAQATRVAIERAAEYEARFFAARLVFVVVLGLAVVAFTAVAIRALLRLPKPFVVAGRADGEANHTHAAQNTDAPVQTDLPPTRVVLDPAAAQRIKEILDFQDANADADDEGTRQ